jgi:molybdopterin converting factor small subunit
MSVNMEISSNNQLHFKVKGSTVGECLNDLARQFPDLKKVLLDKNSKLIHGYDIYVNGESAYPLEMTRPVKEGDKINIVFVIHGG